MGVGYWEETSTDLDWVIRAFTESKVLYLVRGTARTVKKNCRRADLRLSKIFQNMKNSSTFESGTGKTGTLFMFLAQCDKVFSSPTCFFMALLAHISV